MERDPYLYPDINVLKNKLGIKDKMLLEKYENDITFTNLISIDKCKDGSPLDFDYLKKIHKHIFGDIYEWAGEVRTIGMAKSEVVLGGDTVRYSSPADIVKDANKAIRSLQSQNWGTLTLDEKVSTFSRLIANLWQSHPFREGNTRSVMTFACHYAEQHGFPLEMTVFKNNPSYTRNALVCASDGMYARFDYLDKIIKGAMLEGIKSSCKKEIIKAGFTPTEKNINSMSDLSILLNKNLTVIDIKDKYLNLSLLKNEEKDLVNGLVDEFRKEELKAKQKCRSNEPDIG